MTNSYQCLWPGWKGEVGEDLLLSCHTAYYNCYSRSMHGSNNMDGALSCNNKGPEGGVDTKPSALN